MPPPRDATDCLDFENHQQLDVLFTCWVDGVQQPCIEPQVVHTKWIKAAASLYIMPTIFSSVILLICTYYFTALLLL